MDLQNLILLGKRLKKILKNKLHEYDVIHDNQSLCYELLYLQKKIPLVTTIHHPISKDLKYELQSISSIFFKNFKNKMAFISKNANVCCETFK